MTQVNDCSTFVMLCTGRLGRCWILRSIFGLFLKLYTCYLRGAYSIRLRRRLLRMCRMLIRLPWCTILSRLSRLVSTGMTLGIVWVVWATCLARCFRRRLLETSARGNDPVRLVRIWVAIRLTLWVCLTKLLLRPSVRHVRIFVLMVFGQNLRTIVKRLRIMRFLPGLR